MNYPITINFTPAEWQVIEHRLAVPDAIAEALTDAEEGEEPALPVHRDEVADAALNMSGPVVTLVDDIDLEVLRDAIEGSTMPAITLDAIELSGESTEEAWGRNTRRHFKAIERKFEAATGIEARFPRL
jgi:hypothetical protein